MLYYVDLVCAILVRGLNFVFHVLPIRLTLWLGGQFGRVVYYLSKERRIIGYANLKAAFSREKSPPELKKMIKKVYRSLVRVFFEVLALTKVDAAYVNKYVEIVNPENIFKIADHPHGIILLTAHFGNWELSGMVSAIKGFPLVVLAREQKMKRLNELINMLRESKGLKVVRKGTTTRYIVEALHEGRMIGMVGDQDAGKTGTFVRFFGRPASTAPGSARIASKTGALILPAFIARINGPYHRLIVEKPIRVRKGEDVAPYLRQYNTLLEKYVRKYPDQWLWLHKRWKSTPLKKVLILSDGKAGHLNQAKAVTRELKRYREDAGYKAGDTEVDIVEPRFKNAFSRTLLNLVSLFSGKGCQGCMRCLKFCLTKESYKNLTKRYADIVISCGSGVSGVNRLLSVENNAKSAVVMKPAFLSLNRFDMVVMPRHDSSGSEGKHVIVTDIVPNLVDGKYLEDSSKKISEIAQAKSALRIGVLLGGDNADFTLTKGITEELLGNVIDASRKLDADILFTTSRRTSRESENLIKDRLKGEKRCKLLVIANEKNIPDAVGGVLGLSDLVVVSGESSSMVSEAVLSGKVTIAFKLKKRRRARSKFEIMLNNLGEKGHVIVTNADELSGAICRNSHTPKREPVPRDMHNIYMHMWRLGV